MSIYFHKLNGCAPTPLASYLKALGILRLVTEQVDPTARGAWRDEAFILATKLTPEELADFFLTKYEPTPILAPWNSGSGFLKEDAAAALLNKFEHSPLPRLARYKAGVTAARLLCNELSEAKQFVVQIKEETKDKSLSKAQRDALRKAPDYKARLAVAERTFKRLKEIFIPECRLHWRGPHLEWFEAAITLTTDLSVSFPALLGSGGNDGNLDFTDNFRQRFAELFNIQDACAPNLLKTHELLAHALFAVPVLGTGNYAIGQYSPGVAGGANSSNGLEGKGSVNSWDFILFLEGTLLFSPTASRRLKTNQTGSASSPFTLDAQSFEKHLATVAKDKRQPSEQWMPLWSRYATLRELRSLLGEGRAQLGRSLTQNPIDMARAIARLGVTRGISAFERYGYLKRNGDSRFAVPLGRWQVSTQPRQELLGDLDEWLVRLHRVARGDRAANALVTAVKRLDESILAATTNAVLPRRWQNILLAIADIDLLAAKGVLDSKDPNGNKKKGYILTSLRPDWITAADDGTTEFRLALALATQYKIRRHWLPLNQFGKLDESGVTSVVCHGRDLVADTIAFIDRRLVESNKNAVRSIDQTSIHPDLCADLRDIAAFLQGSLDHNRILNLARALMALDVNALRKQAKTQLAHPDGPVLVDDAFALFRLCLAPQHWQSTVPVRADVFRRLASGDITTAAHLATRHLRAHGILPPVQIIVGAARLFAASLAFPLSRSSHDLLVRTVTIGSTNN